MEFRKALLYTFTSKYLLLLIQFGSTLILSRLLTPADIGIYTIAYSLVAIGHIFRDFGVGNYIQQEKNLTNDRLRACMTIALVFAWLMSLLLYFISGFAAEFYNEEGVKKVFQVLALNFVLIPFGSVTTSYIRRQMRFKFVMNLEVTCTLISTATVIILAYLGFSYMSMAWSSLAGIIVEIAILIYFRPQELPNFPGLKEIKHVLAFSTASVSEALLSQLGAYLPDLIIGRFLGMNAVGLLSRAKGTINLFDRAVTSAINPVLLPYFSKEEREGKNIKEAFLYVTTCVTVLAWPALAYMAIMAEPLIYILYGEQWLGAAVLLQIICLRQLIGRLMAFIHPVLMSKGKVKVLLKLQLVFVPLEIIIILLTVEQGLKVMLFSLLIMPFVRLLFLFNIVQKEIDLSISELLDIIIKCGTPTLITMLPILLFKGYWTGSALVDLAATSSIAVILFTLSIFAFKHPLSVELKKIILKAK